MFRLLMTVAFLGLATLGAQAAPPKPLIATDVQCNGCVNQQDIAANAVGAAQIQQDAVGSSEIAQASVGEPELSQGVLSRISAVETAVAASHQGPLTAVFADQNGSTYCSFLDLRNGGKFYADVGNRTIIFFNTGSVSTDIVGYNLADPRRRAVEMLIRINNLPLTPDDFRDPITGEWNCTNERLLSLW